jgi:hypothetical protein
MRRKTELMCAWSGVPFVALFFVGLLVVAGWVPPPSPSNSAELTARMYLEHTTSIRIGLLLCFLSTMFMLAFGSGIVGQTRRIPGVAPAVTYFQVASFSAASLIIIFPIMCWWTAAFRPDTRTAESIQLVNDLGWLCFVVGFAPYVTWAVSTGMAILSDTGDDPVFPRWAGYVSYLVGFVQIPPGLLVFFKTGPFAWDGIASWWIPMFDFFGWIVVITALSVRAVPRQDTGTSAIPLEHVG